MIPIQIIAAILLLARLASDFYMARVLRKQWKLLKLPIEPEIKRFRKVLFILSIVIFVGNFIPIIIDSITLLYGNPGRPAAVRPISLMYAVSNASVAFFSAYLIHLLYKLADNPEEASKDIRRAIRKEHKNGR
jgi:hypothetical protein